MVYFWLKMSIYVYKYVDLVPGLRYVLKHTNMIKRKLECKFIFYFHEIFYISNLFSNEIRKHICLMLLPYLYFSRANNIHIFQSSYTCTTLKKPYISVTSGSEIPTAVTLMTLKLWI